MIMAGSKWNIMVVKVYGTRTMGLKSKKEVIEGRRVKGKNGWLAEKRSVASKVGHDGRG